MQTHREFQQPQSSPTANQPPCERCAEAVREHLKMKPLRAKKATRTKRASKRLLAGEA
jgi:hypothetical protein